MKLFSSREDFHRKMYLLLLVVAGVGLVYSRSALSSAQIGLLANWLLEGKFKNKFQVLKEHKSILLFSSIWIIHVLGLFHTQDFDFALRDLQIKLPVLILPIIIGTSKRIEFVTFKNIIYIFSTVLVTKTLYSTAILFGFTGQEITDIRQIAFKFSHIRFALLINLSIFFLIGFTFFGNSEKSSKENIIRIITAVWLSVFLVIFLKSSTGIALWGITVLIFLFFILKQKSKVLKISLSIFVAAGIVFGGAYFAYTVSKYIETENYNLEGLSKQTSKGNPYWHDTENKQRENGNYTGLYLCEKEIKLAWNSKSKIPYEGKCKDGNIIKYTLIRYLTSKGLKKDAEGFSKLSVSDISNIENGLANHIYENNVSLYPKLYKIYWQIEAYTLGGNPSGHSVTQRIEFLNIGIKIIKENLLWGVGTGDLQLEYDEMYTKTNSVLNAKFRLRAHNQFVTFFIAFGIIGGTYILISLIFPIIKEKAFKNYFALIVVITGLASMVDEDTLESQIGVTFFVLFYSLVIWGVDLTKKEAG